MSRSNIIAKPEALKIADGGNYEKVFRKIGKRDQDTASKHVIVILFLGPIFITFFFSGWVAR